MYIFNKFVCCILLALSLDCVKKLLLWLKNPNFRKRASRFLFFYFFPFRAKDLFNEIASSDNNAIAATGRVLLAFSQKEDMASPAGIEKLRAHLMKDSTRLSFPDHGAGSGTAKDGKLKIKEASVARICANTTKSPRWAMLLHLLTLEHKPQSCLELGTALGLSSAYIGDALRKNGNGSLITIEGATPLANIAQENLEQLGLSEIVTIKNGTFKEVLPHVLQDNIQFDFVFIDGHHEGEATIEYYKMLKPYLNSGAVLVFDDIYYSEDMQKAWESIKKERCFKLVADLGQFGICLYTNSSTFRPIEITC